MRLIISGSLAVLLLAACGGGGTTTPTTPGDSPAPSASPSQAGEAITCMPDERQGDVNAAVVDFAFDPESLSASAGQTIVWTNTGQAPHTVTFDDGPDCGRMNAGGQTAAQFNAPGDYAFHCDIHPTMRGTVSVSN